MSEPLEHRHKRPCRPSFQAIGRFLDTIDPLLSTLGAVAGIVLAVGLLVQVFNGHHVGVL